MTRVLVVVDEARVRCALRIHLTAHGHHVTVACDGASALRAVAGFRPDVVVLDLPLTDLDGIEVIAGLRCRTPVPAIVLSARVESSDEVHALDAASVSQDTCPARYTVRVPWVTATWWWTSTRLTRSGCTSVMVTVPDRSVCSCCRFSLPTAGDRRQVSQPRHSTYAVVVAATSPPSSHAVCTAPGRSRTSSACAVITTLCSTISSHVPGCEPGRAASNAHMPAKTR